MKRSVVGLLVLAAIASGCNNNQGSAPQSRAEALTRANPVFNTADKSIESNKNMLVAVAKLKDEQPGTIWAKAEAVKVSTLTKSPYASIGKLFKVTGTIYKVEELPPDANLIGKWAELLILSDNPNSAAGVTTVDYIYNGDVSKIDAGQVVTCAGYFLGTYESQNAMGGTVEAVTILGNKILQK